MSGFGFLLILESEAARPRGPHPSGRSGSLSAGTGSTSLLSLLSPRQSSEGTAGGHLQAHEGQRGDLRGDVGRRRAGAAQALRHVGRLPRRPALRSRRPWQASLAPTHRDAEVLPDRAAPFLQLLHLPPGCPPQGRALAEPFHADPGQAAAPRPSPAARGVERIQGAVGSSLRTLHLVL